RRLYPEYSRHNLDALIERHGLQRASRHRAMGDAEAIRQFVSMVAAGEAAQVVQPHIVALTRRPSLPPRLSWERLEQIPDTPGVYLFHDERGTPLYVGKSINLRTRVLSHFAADHSSQREMQIAQQTAQVDWQECAGELGALLREAQLVKELAPVYNRQLRRHAALVSIRWNMVDDAMPSIVGGAEAYAGGLGGLYGLFRSRAQAKKILLELADEHRLCLRLIGLGGGLSAAAPVFATRWVNAAVPALSMKPVAAPGAACHRAGKTQARELAVEGCDRHPRTARGECARGAACDRSLVLSWQLQRRTGATPTGPVCTAPGLRYGHLQAAGQAPDAQQARRVVQLPL
ncbi:MAG: GIY-YIG nuclease family protein, partial [Gammaproteobacteria bacterium]|nr:GIY-YIG nuclease family protein [Gammaproteobacteria bacterium]